MTTALMLFGRFQPPTKAHEMIFKVIETGDYTCSYIFISPTQDNKINPLPLSYRYRLLSKLYPFLNFIANPTVKNPFDAICYLGKMNFENVVILAGADRIEKYKTLGKYVNHPDPTKTIPNVKKLFVTEVGHRDPNSPRFLEHISSSMARKAVMDRDFMSFEYMLPNFSLDDKIQLYTSIRAGLSKL